MTIWASTIVGNQDGQTVEVTMGWTASVPATAANGNAIANVISAAWSSDIMPYLVDDYQMTGVDVVSIDDPLVAGFSSLTATGAETTGPLPMFVVGNVQLVTGVRGRSYQGRWGLPGLNLADVGSNNGNVLSPTAVTKYQDAIDDFYSTVDLASPGLQPVVISRISGGTPRPAPIATFAPQRLLQAALGSRVSRKG